MSQFKIDFLILLSALAMCSYHHSCFMGSQYAISKVISPYKTQERRIAVTIRLTVCFIKETECFYHRVLNTKLDSTCYNLATFFRKFFKTLPLVFFYADQIIVSIFQFMQYNTKLTSHWYFLYLKIQLNIEDPRT